MRKLLPLLLAVSLFFAACGGSDDSSDTATATSAGSETTAAATETTAASETTAATETTTAAETTTTATETTTTAATGGGADTAALEAALERSAAQSARMEGTMTMTGVEGFPAGTDLTMSFSGAFDSDGNSSMIMDLSEIAGMAPEGEEMPAEMMDLMGEMEIRTIGDTSYLRFPLFSLLGVSTEWVSMPAEEGDAAASSFGGSTGDPFGIAEAWLNSNAEIEVLGNETVRGVNTTGYRVTIDVAQLAEESGEMTLQELEDLAGVLPTGKMPVEFWVGDDSYVYRISMLFEGVEDETAGFESMTMLWEMWDHDTAITIEAPPADQVTDGTSLAGMFSG